MAKNKAKQKKHLNRYLKQQSKDVKAHQEEMYQRHLDKCWRQIFVKSGVLSDR